jgi:alkylhydroperoxidase/carboxymuconolactone decarboxylase family protein YurZ
MEALTNMLTDAELAALRAGYDATALLDLKVSATAAAYPPHSAWAQATRDTFFAERALSARQRELCIIALLGFRAPTLSLATHVYAALMEGCSVAEVCEAIGLSGAYGGLPAYTEAMAVVQRTLAAMKRVAAAPAPATATAIWELVSVFGGQGPNAAR